MSGFDVFVSLFPLSPSSLAALSQFGLYSLALPSVCLTVVVHSVHSFHSSAFVSFDFWLAALLFVASHHPTTPSTPFSQTKRNKQYHTTSFSVASHRVLVLLFHSTLILVSLSFLHSFTSAPAPKQKIPLLLLLSLHFSATILSSALSSLRSSATHTTQFSVSKLHYITSLRFRSSLPP